MHFCLVTNISECSTLSRYLSESNYCNSYYLLSSWYSVYGNIYVIGNGPTADAPHFLLFIWPHASARRTRELMGQADLCSVPTLPILSTLAKP